MNEKQFCCTQNAQYESLEDGVAIYAPPGSDYFVNPADGTLLASAPFLYQEVTGDFVLRSKARHDFTAVYDACALLAKDHDRLWAKACFEYTDLATHAIVSVMTNQHSDDANGVTIPQQEVWLQLARKGNMFAVHTSLDGVVFTMERLTYLPMHETIQVGFEAQSPRGKGGMRYFMHTTLEHRTLSDIRNGNYE